MAMLNFAVLALLAVNFLSSMAVAARRPNKVFGYVDGVKCVSKDDSWKEFFDVEDAKKCWKLCARKKRCAMAQYNANDNKDKCVMWRTTTPCVEFEKADGFGIAGRVDKDDGYFTLPRGWICSGPTYGYLSDNGLDGQPSIPGDCIDACDDKRKCVAVTNWLPMDGWADSSCYIQNKCKKVYYDEYEYDDRTYLRVKVGKTIPNK